jgi:hypothetical protein
MTRRRRRSRVAAAAAAVVVEPVGGRSHSRRARSVLRSSSGR